MTKRRVILWGLVGVLLLALAGVIYIRSGPLVTTQLLAVAPLVTDCDLHAGPCTAGVSGGGAVTLSITPRPIPVIQPMQLQVRTQAMDVRAISVEFTGVDMNMGVNRFSLAEQSGGSYRGEGILPVCMRQRMAWQADVTVSTAQGQYVFPFRFETQARY